MLHFVSLLNWKKIESHFETSSSDAQRINLTFVAYSFVATFVRYISAKQYLNWFPIHTVIMKVLAVNFFLKHSTRSVYIHIMDKSGSAYMSCLLYIFIGLFYYIIWPCLSKPIHVIP